jgi:nitroreductase
MAITTLRRANARIHPLIVRRWSPRSFDGRDITQKDLDVIFEAAGLAPSAYKHQPWRFLYSHRCDPYWQTYLGLLHPFNASWAREAAVLVFVISQTVVCRDGKASPIHSHSFDAGAAWAFLALQATALGYHAHGIAGIDSERARVELRVPGDFTIEAAVAIGRRGDPARLPETLRAREMPSDRNPVSSFAIAGTFT